MSDNLLEELYGLNGKVAVVTGGGGVLGGVMGKALASLGAKVVVMDLRLESANAMVAEIEAAGGSAMGVACDVTDTDSIDTAKKAVLDSCGQVDILLNCAGGNHKSATTGGVNVKEKIDPTFFQLDKDAIKFVFDLNYLGTLLVCQSFGKEMVDRQDGCIINISSMSGLTPLTKVGTYSAAKAAINNFTQWLSVHLAPAKVRVNAIAPGFFLTDQNRFLLTDEKTGELTQRGETIVSQTPMGRFGDPEDLLSTLVWLCGSGSRFVTGTVIPVDGGFAAFSGV